MPARLSEDRLGIAAVFSDGTSAEFSVDQPALGAGLAGDLLAALVEMVHPHGELDAAGSVRLYVAAARNMAAALAEVGFTGGAGELTRAQLAQYWLAAPAWAEGCTRRLMRAFGQAGGTQAGGVAELAAGRAYKSRDTHPLKPYGESEWAALTEACAEVVAESYRAHRAALAGATRGADPAVAGWSPDNLRWLLARTGPATLAAVSAQAGLPVSVARARGGYAQASTGLFPHIDVVVGYRLRGCIRVSFRTASMTWSPPASTGPGMRRSCCRM